jgi:hypothetical protein
MDSDQRAGWPLKRKSTNRIFSVLTEALRLHGRVAEEFFTLSARVLRGSVMDCVQTVHVCA